MAGCDFLQSSAIRLVWTAKTVATLLIVSPLASATVVFLPGVGEIPEYHNTIGTFVFFWRPFPNFVFGFFPPDFRFNFLSSEFRFSLLSFEF